MARRRLTVPAPVQAAAKGALHEAPGEIPDIAIRLAGGWCWDGDREAIALFALDKAHHYGSGRVSVMAALHGGHAGRDWALAALDTRVDMERLMTALSHEDLSLPRPIATAISLAWRRALDHAELKTRSRMHRSSDTRGIAFMGFPNKRAAEAAGLDDLFDKAWDALAIEVRKILAEYAQREGSLVAQIDPAAGRTVQQEIDARSAQAVVALNAYMNDRAKGYVVGNATPPEEFAVARGIAIWVSGVAPPPAGFEFADLTSVAKISIIGITTAEAAMFALSPVKLVPSLTWEHGYYGQPMQPFEPHLELDGEDFTVEDAGKLIVFPGDHLGCKCEWVPTWTAVG